MPTLAITLDKLPLVEASTDPDDNYLLALAAAGAADFLVTGDKKLVSITALVDTSNLATRKAGSLRQA